MIKLIALDMDGTLLNDDWDVTERTKAAIQSAQAQGVKVILSTGRPYGRCKSYIEELNLDSYTITANGGQIYDPEGKIVIEETMDADLIEKLANLGQDEDVNMWYITTEDVIHDGGPVDFSAHKWLKIGFSNLDRGQKERLTEALKAFDDIEITNSLPTNIEINQKGVNKANAVEYVCQQLNIPMDDVFAIGDSMNDYEMLKKVGTGIAMANAQDKIKNIAKAISEDNNHDGVGKAIEKYVLNTYNG